MMMNTTFNLITGATRRPKPVSRVHGFLRGFPRALCLAVALLFAGVGSVQAATIEINSTNFPDGTFRSYVQNTLFNKATSFTTAQAATITSMNVSHKYISKLKGIEYFTNLKKLDASYNRLTSFSFPALTKLETLNLSNNSLTSLSVSSNKSLTSLDVSYNSGLGSLNVSALTALTSLKAAGCGLSGVSVTSNTALTLLDVSTNSLTALDVSKCGKLVTLNVSSNSGISTINLKSNPNLTYLRIGSTSIPELDLSSNPALVSVSAALCTKLTSIDLSKCKSLTYLDLYKCALPEIDLTNNTALTNLDVSYNELTSLNVSNNTVLDSIEASNNHITELDVSTIDSLQYLAVRTEDQYGPGLSSLDVTKNKKLQELFLDYSQIKTIDLSPDSLVNLSMIGCKLETIDLSKNKYLQELRLYWNQLTHIDLTNNTKLKTGRNTDISEQRLTKAVYLKQKADKSYDAYVSMPSHFNMGYVTSGTPKFKSAGTTNSVTFTLGDADASGDKPLYFTNYGTHERQTLFKCKKDGSKLRIVSDTLLYTTSSNNTVAGEMEVDMYVTAYLLPLFTSSATDNGTVAYASVCLPFAYTMPSDVDGYIVTQAADKEVTIAKAYSAGEVVPAKTPLIICKEGTTTYDKPMIALNQTDATGDTSPATGNLLLGTLNTTVDASDKSLYLVLGGNNETQEIGFWRTTQDVINDYRAYLPVSAFSDTAAAKGFSLHHGDDGTTGITAVTEADLSHSDGYWYTLSGTRLNAKPSAKGIYIYQGRKVVIK